MLNANFRTHRIIGATQSMMSPEWKYKIVLVDSDWMLAQKWCQDNIGPFGEDWYKLGMDPAEWIVSSRVTSTWYFKDEKTASMFALKWS